jgi:hypothetical protein
LTASPKKALAATWTPSPLLREGSRLACQAIFLPTTGIGMNVATPVEQTAGGSSSHISHRSLVTTAYLANVVPVQARLGNRHRASTGYRGITRRLRTQFQGQCGRPRARGQEQTKSEFKRRAAIEPVIGTLREGPRMSRNYLSPLKRRCHQPSAPPASFNG